MSNSFISKEFLAKMLKELSSEYKVTAPIRNGKVLEFKEISDNSEIIMNDEVPYKSPKECFFPQVEKLFTFDESGVVESVQEKKSIVFGVKPCDAEAIRVLSKIFVSGKFEDPFYKKHFDNTTIIAVGCINEKPGCFCAYRGIDKSFSDSCDIMLYSGDDGASGNSSENSGEREDGYYVEYLSEKGKELLSKFEETKDIEPREPREGRDVAKSGADRKTLEFDLEFDEAKFFDIIDWEDASRICQGCGLCTFICPTCHCFDFKDKHDQGKTNRYRCWDSCMYPNFTLHASGHNPRMSVKERYRQRVLHKYLYMNKNFGYIGCFGCGRCIRSCPVGMDIKKVVESVMENVRESAVEVTS
ncbi:MAG: 4Fe-4S dicluster domain-containing protein [Oscillospiraceae bacterium]|nr:4Fe-4S dicluster domain-containing protein [Oscillospiraceae bacterium]